MSLLIISIFVNCLVLIASAQEEATANAFASASADAASSVVNLTPNSGEYKSRTVPKIYTECGSACPKTCARPEPEFCPQVCRPGRICPKDYYENSAGECVLLADCDSISSPPRRLPGHTVGPRPIPISSPFPINDSPSSWPSEFKPRTAGKIYNECGTACPKTCARPEPGACRKNCNPGWFCPENFYENSAGECVLLADCDSRSSPPRHLPGLIVDRPPPQPGNFGGFSNFPNFPNFPQFNATETELPKIILPMGPPRPRPIFQFDPVNYNATAVANGAPVPPPAVVRTSGSNLPYIKFPSMVPKAKPLIDLDPTVLRPALRVSQEQSSDADED